jgi:hypothetical protein
MLWCLFVTCGVGVAQAQDGGDGDAQREKKGGVEVFDEDHIEVEADLPRVDFILDFKGLKYESLDHPEDFIPELLESVEEEPF